MKEPPESRVMENLLSLPQLSFNDPTQSVILNTPTELNEHSPVIISTHPGHISNAKVSHWDSGLLYNLCSKKVIGL